MKTSKQVRRNLTKSASSRKQSSGEIRLHHGVDLKPGKRIGPLLMPGLGGFWSYSDESLLKFVAEFIAYNFSAPCDLSTEAALDLAEAVIIAETVDATAAFDQGFRFPLPGIAAYRTMSLEATLEYLANLWHRSSAKWPRQFHYDNVAAELPVLGLVCVAHGPFLYAQVSVICESVLVRAGTLEQMQYEGAAHRIATTTYAAALAKSVECAPEVIAKSTKRN